MTTANLIDDKKLMNSIESSSSLTKYTNDVHIYLLLELWYFKFLISIDSSRK